MDDSGIDKATPHLTAQYSLYTGAYCDNGNFYGYDGSGNFYRTSAENLNDYEQLEKWTLDPGDEVITMAYNRKSGEMLGFTLQHWLVKIDLETGHTEHHEGVPQQNGSYICAMTVDKNDMIWGAGSATAGTPSTLYVLDLENSRSRKFATHAGLLSDDGPRMNIFTTAGAVRPRMTYDEKTDRIYLYGRVFKSDEWKMACLQLDHSGYPVVTEAYYLGPVAVENTTPNNMISLGLLAFVPVKEDGRP